MRYINKDDVKSSIGMSEVINAMRIAFSQLSKEEIILPFPLNSVYGPVISYTR